MTHRLLSCRAGASRRLAGHLWHAITPSHYQLDSYPVALVFNGRTWYLAFNGSADGARPWPSRDSAAAAIAQAFLEHERERELI